MSHDPLIVPISVHCIVFLRACLCGAALALVCDVFRILRRAFRFPTALVAAQDLFCCVVFCLGSFLFLLSQCSGRLRWFAIVGEILGAVLYWALLGEPLVKLGAWILKRITGVLLWIFGQIKRLAMLLWRIISCPVLKLRVFFLQFGKSSKKILKKSVKTIKFRLKHQAGLLYNARKTRSDGRSLPKPKRNGKG